MSKRRNPSEAAPSSSSSSSSAAAKKSKTASSSAEKSEQPSISGSDVEQPRAETLEETWMTKMANDFRCLELVLNTYRAGGKVAVWDRIHDSVQQLSTQCFTLDDLSLLMQVWPEGYACNWRKVAPDSLSVKDWHLCIAASTTASTTLPTLSAASSSSLGRSQVKNRLDYFAQRLAESSTTLLPDMSVIPAKPTKASIDAKKEHDNNHKRKSSVLSTLFTATELSGLQERNKFIDAVSGSSTLLGASTSSTTSMEELRQMAIEREASSKLRESELKEESKKASTIAILNSLTPLCDSLRSLALSRNRRSVFVASELLKELAPSLRISQHDLRMRLQKVCEALPEFLTILPPDNRIGVETIRINLHCNYAEVRKKTDVYVASQLLIERGMR